MIQMIIMNLPVMMMMVIVVTNVHPAVMTVPMMALIMMVMVGVMQVIIGRIVKMIQSVQTRMIYVVFVMEERLNLAQVIWIVMVNVMKKLQ